jgi:hypothetical protein
MRIRGQFNFVIAGRRLFVPASFLLASFGIIICRVLPAMAETKVDIELLRLILTDEQHIVVAEGFGFDKLGDKFKQND